MAVEDFTTYTELDPGDKIAVASATLTWSSLNVRYYDSYVYKDFGAAHFSGDLTHTFQLRATAYNEQTPYAAVWALANAVDDLHGIAVGGGDYQAVALVNSAGTYLAQLRLCEDGAEQVADILINQDVDYYVTIARDDDGGVNGTGRLTLTVALGDYYGQPGCTDSASTTLDCSAGQQNDFRYLYATCTFNTGDTSRYLSAVISSLDLHEVSPTYVDLAGSIAAASSASGALAPPPQSSVSATSAVSASLQIVRQASEEVYSSAQVLFEPFPVPLLWSYATAGDPPNESVSQWAQAFSEWSEQHIAKIMRDMNQGWESLAGFYEPFGSALSAMRTHEAAWNHNAFLISVYGQNHSTLDHLDYADSGHTGFEPTVAKGDLTAGSSKVTVGGSGTGALIGSGASIDVAEGNLTHNNLGGLQGGVAGEYHHMTSAQISALHVAVTLGSLTGVTLTGQQLSLTAGYVIPTTTQETHWDAAYSASHARQHSITGTDDHTSAATAGQLLKADANGLPVDATSTDAAVAAAVAASHAAVTIPGSSNGLSLTGQEISFPATATPEFTMLGIGVAAAVRGLLIHGLGAKGTAEIQRVVSGTAPASFIFQKARGDALDAMTTVAPGDRIGGIQCDGYDGDSWVSSAYFGGIVDDTVSDGVVPQALQFLTGTTGLTERMRITSYGDVGIGVSAPNEALEVGGKIRANIAFNINGTDGVTQAAAAGKVSDVTALAGGIATAQTQVTPVSDGAHSLAGITSVTTVNGRITAMA